MTTRDKPVHNKPGEARPNSKSALIIRRAVKIELFKSSESKYWQTNLRKLSRNDKKVKYIRKLKIETFYLIIQIFQNN